MSAGSAGSWREEKRQRPNLVGVRLNDEEYAILLAASDREGRTAAALLREAFLEREQQRGSSDA